MLHYSTAVWIALGLAVIYRIRRKGDAETALLVYVLIMCALGKGFELVDKALEKRKPAAQEPEEEVVLARG